MSHRLSCVWVPLLITIGVAQSGCESATNNTNAIVEAPSEVAIPETMAEPSIPTFGFRPATSLKGTFEGTVWLNTPAGDVLGVNVTARVGRASDAAESWDLYFFDATNTLAANGQLSLKSGTARWLTRDDDRAFVQAEWISLGRDVLASPGWSLLQHPVSGDIKGEAWMRVPSSGADLPPLRLTFFLHPRDLVACNDDCSAGNVCDSASGFCATKPFAPGEFRGDLELTAVHEGLGAWSYGPEVSSTLSVANIWCANDAMGFRGEWTTPNMGTMARAVMPLSGDLFCLEPANPFTGARSRGPIPLTNRRDLEDTGLLLPMDDDRLAHLCTGELERRAPLGFANRFGETSASFESFRDGYLNYEADCVSMGHFAALVHLAQTGIFSDENAEKKQLSRRAMSRLLQQWIQLHSFVATKNSDLSAQARLSTLETGWAAVLQLLGSSALEYLIDPSIPDYRQGLRFGLCRNGCGDPALRCEITDEVCSAGVCRQKQCVLNEKAPAVSDPASGLAASLMDGLAVHMKLVEQLLRQSKGEPAAAQSYGQSMRYALLVESLTDKLVQLGTRCESPGITGCPVPSWMGAFELSKRRFLSARQGATSALAAVLNENVRRFPSLEGQAPAKPL